jgi:hypothetical protein
MRDLKSKWGLHSNFQLVIILIVFAINGSLSAKISSFFMQKMDITKDNIHLVLYYFILILLVLPLYPFTLILFGYVFGQSKFFFPFAKKILKHIGLGFIFEPSEKP